MIILEIIDDLSSFRLVYNLHFRRGNKEIRKIDYKITEFG